MPRQPFAHQDASGDAGAPLAVFVDGRFAEHINTATDPHGYKAMDKILTDLAPHRPSIEVLTTCINHPTEAAVDCLTCDPMED